MPGIAGGPAGYGRAIVNDRCARCFNGHCVLTSTSKPVVDGLRDRANQCTDIRCGQAIG
jgi:hypothetical protein